MVNFATSTRTLLWYLVALYKVGFSWYKCVLFIYIDKICIFGASQVTQWVKNPRAIQEIQADASSIPRSKRSSGGGHSSPLQYSCLENPMDRGAWWATVHRVAKSQTRLKRLSTHMQLFISYNTDITSHFHFSHLYLSLIFT